MRRGDFFVRVGESILAHISLSGESILDSPGATYCGGVPYRDTGKEAGRAGCALWGGGAICLAGGDMTI